MSMGRSTGIEPSSTVCNTAILPLNYRSINLVEDNGFEPFAPGCKPGVLAKYTNPPNSFLVVKVTLEVTHSSV